MDINDFVGGTGQNVMFIVGFSVDDWLMFFWLVLLWCKNLREYLLLKYALQINMINSSESMLHSLFFSLFSVNLFLPKLQLLEIFYSISADEVLHATWTLHNQETIFCPQDNKGKYPSWHNRRLWIQDSDVFRITQPRWKKLGRNWLQAATGRIWSSFWFTAHPISHPGACLCCFLVSLWSGCTSGPAPKAGWLVKRNAGDLPVCDWQADALNKAISESADGRMDPTETQLKSGQRSKPFRRWSLPLAMSGGGGRWRWFCDFASLTFVRFLARPTTLRWEEMTACGSMV